MCTGIVENTKVCGSGRGREGWISIDRASVSYDHPDHAQIEQDVIIDFLSQSMGPDSRIAVELTPESARDLVKAIQQSLSRGERKMLESEPNIVR
jgi:hypothetical protein